MKKDEYLKLLLDTRDAGKRAQKNVGKRPLGSARPILD
jgi:hypothetical protein